MTNLNTVTVYSPLSGKVVPIEKVPDPAFAEKLLGDGMAVNPDGNIVYAPFDGRVKTLNKSLHAVVVENSGIEILIHIGIETVGLKGEGFKAFIRQGAEIKKGDKLIEFDKNVIAAHNLRPEVVVVVANQGNATLDKTTDTDTTENKILFTVNRVEEDPGEQTAVFSSTEPEYISEEIEVMNPNGFHARPVSVITNIAAKYPFKIRLVKNGIGVNAKNLVEIMGLNIKMGDKVRIAGYGPDSKGSVLEIVNAIKAGLNEDIVYKEMENPSDTTIDLDMSQKQILPVKVIYTGKVMGKAFILKRHDEDFEENAKDPAEEKAKLERALSNIKKSIQSDIENSNTDEEKNILKAHASILLDSSITDAAFSDIAKGKTAAFSFNKAIEKSVEILNNTKNPLLMERVADLEDVKRRILEDILNRKVGIEVPAGSILIAEDLLPSDVSKLSTNVSGVVLAQGSATSHASIMLKNIGITSVFSAGKGIMKIAPGADIIVDATTQELYINPSEDTLKKYQTLLLKETEMQRTYFAEISAPSVTKDGVAIEVRGNIGSLSEAVKSYKNGADGVGLLRTEFLFMNRFSAPTEEEQTALYQGIVKEMKGGSVIIRTLDIGGDKPLSYMTIPKEENPILGVRGVRAYQKNEEVIRTQLRAILRVKPLSLVRIMIPMVSFVEDFTYVKMMLDEEKRNLGITEHVDLGIMVETPSAALSAFDLGKVADFFSFGTNDLTQYVLAIDRGHKQLSVKAQSLHPAVLRLMNNAMQSLAMYNKPVGICGAIASEPLALPVLLGLGIRELAVVSGSIPEIKYFIRRLTMSKCKEIAQKALVLNGVKEVEEMIRQELEMM
ncbi:phosphocarrier protein FPr/phosphocarrier protein [Parelusimicrobium proximum]|uniref:phosphoenolpyruvate--protein phosphotransferase n=1 Tax=Parelusimicrobium proximum TaxID=3228953 RepID=UPI003D16FA91